MTENTGMAPKPWSPEEIKVASALWDEGKTCKEIGNAIGRSRSAVSNKVNDLGLKPHKHSKSWSTEQTDAVAKLWREGVSAETIAGQFGITRMAVIGRMRRCGIRSGYVRPQPTRKEQGTSPTRGPRCQRQVRHKKPQEQHIHVWRRFCNGVLMEFRQEFQEFKSEGAPSPVTIIELEDYHCRFPIGPNEAGAQQFCGRNKIIGSYCPMHTLVCYRPDNGGNVNGNK